MDPIDRIMRDEQPLTRGDDPEAIPYEMMKNVFDMISFDKPDSFLTFGHFKRGDPGKIALALLDIRNSPSSAKIEFFLAQLMAGNGVDDYRLARALEAHGQTNKTTATHYIQEKVSQGPIKGWVRRRTGRGKHD